MRTRQRRRRGWWGQGVGSCDGGEEGKRWKGGGETVEAGGWVFVEWTWRVRGGRGGLRGFVLGCEGEGEREGLMVKGKGKDRENGVMGEGSKSLPPAVIMTFVIVVVVGGKALKRACKRRPH